MKYNITAELDRKFFQNIENGAFKMSPIQDPLRLFTTFAGQVETVGTEKGGVAHVLYVDTTPLVDADTQEALQRFLVSYFGDTLSGYAKQVKTQCGMDGLQILVDAIGHTAYEGTDLAMVRQALYGSNELVESVISAVEWNARHGHRYEFTKNDRQPVDSEDREKPVNLKRAQRHTPLTTEEFIQDLRAVHAGYLSFIAPNQNRKPDPQFPIPPEQKM